MMRSRFKQSGQSLVVALGLFALAGVTLFMVLNSHRAVDEKINLVNAADAAAFSGAQLAARQLNFMALTNRTMIANEVAVGHEMAYQVEVDLVANILSGGFTGILGEIFNGAIDVVGGDTVVNFVNNISRVASGTYMLAVNSANARYGAMQESEYRALAGVGKASLLNVVMENVASKYVQGPTLTGTSIVVNDPATLSQFESGVDATVAAAARSARVNPFCAMVMFAKPSAKKPGVYERYQDNPANDKDFESMALYSQCQRYYQTGAEPTAEGSLSAEVEDGGVFLDMINASAKAASSADWVLNRNDDYRILGVNIQRRGESQAVWDASTNQINWKTSSADTIQTSGLLAALLFGFKAEAEGDAKAYAEYARNNLGSPAIQLLKSVGLCDSDDNSAAPSCDDLNKEYTGTRQYAIVNPMMGSSQPVTAFLTQRGNCNDDLGIDSRGNTVSGWHTDQPRFKSAPFCDPGKQIYAYANARVYFERPACESKSGCTMGYSSEKVVSEKPNLFNPFWQARLGN
jgi:hypothetical protein